MTQDEIQKLKDAVAEAEAAATNAGAAVAAEPDNPEKISAKIEADVKLNAARNALAEAEASTRQILRSDDTSDQIQNYKGRIVLLTAYLLAVVFLTIYLLSGLMMAEIDPAEINKRLDEDRCCRAAANSNSNSVAANSNSNANTTNSNVDLPNANETIANANSNGANTNSTTVGNSATGSGQTSSGSTVGSGPAKTSSAPASDTSAANGENANASPTTKATPDYSAPEISVPKNVYVRMPGFSTGDIWSSESYVFLVVLFAGALGGTIRALHSLVKHLGLKDFSFYWAWFYITLPFSGAGLAIVIYFVLRGGFYGGGFGKGLVLNIFSFAALAALTGLFSDNAMEKLKQVAVTLLADVPPKVDNANEIQARKEAEKKTP
jgi:hypothetical protein